jgi:hypothetical protein
MKTARDTRQNPAADFVLCLRIFRVPTHEQVRQVAGSSASGLFDFLRLCAAGPHPGRSRLLRFLPAPGSSVSSWTGSLVPSSMLGSHRFFDLLVNFAATPIGFRAAGIPGLVTRVLSLSFLSLFPCFYGGFTSERCLMKYL